MNIKLKDVLHFYIGVNYWTENSEGNLNATTLPNVIDMIKRGKNVQLHLRKLDSMTEREAIECAKLSEWEPHFVNPVVNRTKYNDLVVEWADGHEKQNVTGDLFWCPEQVVYLCSEGFDIFNLIPTGQAIDATKEGGAA
jgi:hypothetical protein